MTSEQQMLGEASRDISCACKVTSVGRTSCYSSRTEEKKQSLNISIFKTYSHKYIKNYFSSLQKLLDPVVRKKKKNNLYEEKGNFT